MLKQHLELLHTPNNNKNMQSRAPKYDESVLNVQGIENAMYAAKCYAECLKNEETESNCTMLLYGPLYALRIFRANWMRRAIAGSIFT